MLRSAEPPNCNRPLRCARTLRLSCGPLIAIALVALHAQPASAATRTNPGSLLPITVPVMPGQGVAFHQVSYNWDTSPDPNSQVGEVEVDIATLAASTGQSSGFINVGTSLGWVVQNLPVDSADPDVNIVTKFEISSADGAVVSTLPADVEYSTAPVSSFSPGSMPAYTVDSTNYNGSGKGTTPVSGVQSPPTPGAITFQGGPILTVCWQAQHANVQAADNQCGPAAVANSLDWLRTTYQLPVPDPNVMGLRDNNSLVGKLDLAMNRGDNTTTRRSGPGVADNAFLTGKLTYLANNNLGNKVVVNHQARNDEGVGGGDFSAAGLTSHGNGAKPTAAFIQQEICAGEDVELGFIYPGGGGHWVELTGAGSILGVPFVTYKSDHNQADDTKGTDKTDFSFLVDSDADGLLNLVNEGTKPNAQIVVTESPAPQSNVPEVPGSAALLLLLPAGAAAASWRRARREHKGRPKLS